MGEITELDSDGDGLNDEDELRYGTDPHKADTDGDGLNDWEEINVRTPYESHHFPPAQLSLLVSRLYCITMRILNGEKEFERKLFTPPPACSTGGKRHAPRPHPSTHV